MLINDKNQKKTRKIFLWAFILLTVVAVCRVFTRFIYAKPKIKLSNFIGVSKSAIYPDINFAVLSDIHFYDKSLGSSGTAFDNAIAADRKMLTYSEELLDSAIDMIIESDAEFILVAGDLTKDGERLNHQRVSEKLLALTQIGINVYVTPGNHDINNFNAIAFDGDNSYSIETISSVEFAEIYAEFGYNQAIMRDDNSLSYVVEPVPGLWILAIDANRYNENTPDSPSMVGGRISQKSVPWIENVLKMAIDQDISVMALMHHGVVEHWKGQAKFSSNHIIEDYPAIGEFLASYHVRTVFTGHYHAQDITRVEFGDNYLYDIETGSLVTSPCPIRFCSLQNDLLSISTVSAAENIGEDFMQISQDFLKRNIFDQAKDILTRFKVSQKDSEYMSTIISEAFVAHYSGDEDIDQKSLPDSVKMGLWGQIVFQTQKYLLDGLWLDLPPSDNNVIINLNRR